jgi:hypothetical protein
MVRRTFYLIDWSEIDTLFIENVDISEIDFSETKSWIMPYPKTNLNFKQVMQDFWVLQNEIAIHLLPLAKELTNNIAFTIYLGKNISQYTDIKEEYYKKGSELSINNIISPLMIKDLLSIWNDNLITNLHEGYIKIDSAKKEDISMDWINFEHIWREILLLLNKANDMNKGVLVSHL